MFNSNYSAQSFLDQISIKKEDVPYVKHIMGSICKPNKNADPKVMVKANYSQTYDPNSPITLNSMICAIFESTNSSKYRPEIPLSNLTDSYILYHAICEILNKQDTLRLAEILSAIMIGYGNEKVFSWDLYEEPEDEEIEASINLSDDEDIETSAVDDPENSVEFNNFFISYLIASGTKELISKAKEAAQNPYFMKDHPDRQKIQTLFSNLTTQNANKWAKAAKKGDSSNNSEKYFLFIFISIFSFIMFCLLVMTIQSPILIALIVITLFITLIWKGIKALFSHIMNFLKK